MSTAITMVRKTLIHFIICGQREAFYSDLQTLILVSALQSCSVEALPDRAHPHQNGDC